MIHIHVLLLPTIASLSYITPSYLTSPMLLSHPSSFTLSLSLPPHLRHRPVIIILYINPSTVTTEISGKLVNWARHCVLMANIESNHHGLSDAVSQQQLIAPSTPSVPQKVRSYASYGATNANPTPTPSSSPSLDTQGKIPPADRGKAAWLFLGGCFWLEGLVWGRTPTGNSLLLIMSVHS